MDGSTLTESPKPLRSNEPLDCPGHFYEQSSDWIPKLMRALLVAVQDEQMRELASGLVESGFSCTIAPSLSQAMEQLTGPAPDLVLAAPDSSSTDSEMEHLVRQIRQEMGLPLIVLVSKQTVSSLNSGVDIDDFVVEPWDAAEVAMRAKRALWRTNGADGGELIRCGDLVIDMGKCEVSLSGRLVALTFKEYELLRFLASKKGRVFTREALVNKVWGYDYYGGDRTVDVHVRRIRSKIEDKDHSFIEKVRNIGYRLKKEM